MSNHSKQKTGYIRKSKSMVVAEFLLIMLTIGLTNWQIIGKAKTPNPTAIISALRKKGVSISRGPRYFVMDKQSVVLLFEIVNLYRKQLGMTLLDKQDLLHYLAQFKD